MYPYRAVSSWYPRMYSHVKLCEWLSKFVSETHKSDGTEYTPCSLYLLLSGIQKRIRALTYFKRPCSNQWRMSAISSLKIACQGNWKLEQKQKLLLLYWTQKRKNFGIPRVIGTADPTALLYAIVSATLKTSVYMGVWHIATWRYLRWDKCVISGKEVNEYVYTEFGSKSNHARRIFGSDKTVHQYEVDSERCHVKILNL